MTVTIKPHALYQQNLNWYETADKNGDAGSSTHIYNVQLKSLMIEKLAGFLARAGRLKVKVRKLPNTQSLKQLSIDLDGLVDDIRKELPCHLVLTSEVEAQAALMRLNTFNTAGE